MSVNQNIPVYVVVSLERVDFEIMAVFTCEDTAQNYIDNHIIDNKEIIVYLTALNPTKNGLNNNINNK